MNAKSSKKSEGRSQVIIKSGYLFIAVNFALAVLNLIIGLLSSSVAIISDAAHSLIDAVSGVIIIGSEKLSSHHKLTKHRAKIERISTVLVALIIIAVGVHIIIESIEKLLDPEPVDYSAPVLIILVLSIAMKYALAVYLKRQGARWHSSVLTASGAETMNDTWISVAVLASAIIYLISGFDIEAYVSLVISVVILKVGLEFIFPKLSHHHHHPFDEHPDHGAKMAQS